MRLTLKRGDTRSALKATLVGPTGTPADLAAAQVQFLMVDVRYVPVISRRATIIDEAAGQVLVVFEPGDTDQEGTYRAEFEVTFADGRRETYPNDSYIIIEIIPDLG